MARSFFVLNINTLLPIWIMTMTLSVFFSVHHLLIHYVFRPYATDSETNMLQAILEYNNNMRGSAWDRFLRRMFLI